ncbi:hypothetical protein, variant [Saprolegnia diclina VS20]|uniref:Uncharacterized protein n=1 Tax=Saprolegnia diclina (strain VS20) TaxID=1156394 RepID=T0RHC9_SAPDV|nr:hypothetical protein SDRG_10511 [Saprolegnia diclina VS20]XP_008614726.1 hypothetical protein, variant [Saprolegnia diclina VS20]EQC31718.1 hypothetical protein SDRG_10511 [Saprolegnia diclina VS20]EQC31719.1 hypothetical protein, variant [Saprolegnia diclina VS20]|eukprot:XP_008614725.1 hypothetical protein SDRG_10511 [Saprolegnia diclina VS20]
MNFSKLFKAPPPPPLEPPPPDAEPGSSPLLKEYVPVRQQRLPEVIQEEQPLGRRRSSVLDAPTITPRHASIAKVMSSNSLLSDTQKSPILTRKPSFVVPNLDMKQFEKDSELLLLINQLKVELQLCQDENAQLQKQVAQHPSATDHNGRSALEQARYYDEKTRYLEMENARLRQMGSNQQSAFEDKKRIAELEDALREAKHTERRALRLVVLALGKENVVELLQAPGMNQKTLEERVRLVVDKRKPKSRSRAPPPKRPQSASPTKAQSAADKAIQARCVELDGLWKKYCNELTGPSKEFADSLRR